MFCRSLPLREQLVVAPGLRLVAEMRSFAAAADDAASFEAYALATVILNSPSSTVNSLMLDLLIAFISS